jgi:hypothetical protein
MKKIFTFILATLMLLVSCQEIVVIYPVYPINGQTGGAILFGNYTPATKAIAGEGPNGVGYGDFKIYGFEDNTVIMDPYTVSWQSNEWVYAGIGTQELKYFNNSANQYSFIGVISDKTPSRDGTTVNVPGVESFQTTDPMDSPKEFLYTQKIVSQSEFGQYINLTFNHANSRMFIGFASDRNDTQILDYVPSVPGTPGTMTTEHAKMFDLLAAGKLVGYGLTSFQGDQNGYYAGMEGNFFNLNPYQGGYNYVSKERLAELMPLVNAQFVYCDENCNAVDKWEYGVEKKDKMFLKFADGVSGSEFIAGNDAFWNNLTDAEKTKMQNYKNSGCRVIRIEKLDDGNYFAWGESYAQASWVSPTSTERDFKVINGGTIGVLGLEGIRVFSVDDSGSPIIHKVHTVKADAHLDFVNAPSYDNVVANSDSIIFNKPTVVVAQSDNTNIEWSEATPSPSIRYALPIANTGYVVKFSYTYNGVNYYDARVLIETPNANFVESKDYTYVIYITDKTNGTTDPNKAKEDKNEVDTTDKAIVFSPVTFGSYTSGGHYVYTVQ